MAPTCFTVCRVSVLLLCFHFSHTRGELTTLVTSSAGSFQGVEDVAPDSSKYVAFRGIPYAQPPVGDLRFAKPRALPKIDGTFDASKPCASCPFPNEYADLAGYQGQEDCLVLNVYTKDVDLTTPKKVMVFIHGGGYVAGSSIDYHSGSFVTSQNVIVVTINYRLGILGFLSTGDDSSPGNFGLWDMTLALQWVKDNIESFGGDPSDVTISGESAGGSAVGYLSISPYTKGLFTKAYPQSGTPTSSFGRFLEPQKAAAKLAKSLNCYDGDSFASESTDVTRKVVQCLRERPLTNITGFPIVSLDNVQFVPTVDGDFIPRVPLELLRDDDYLKDVGFFDRSYLVGIVNNENYVFKNMATAMLYYFITAREDLTDDAKASMRSDLIASSNAFYIKTRIGEQLSDPVVEQIVDWYGRRFGDDSVWQLMGHMGFLVPTYDFIDAASRGPNTNVWLFHFNHYPKFMTGSPKGIIHAFDLVYWFDMEVDMLSKWLNAEMDLEIGMTEEDQDMKWALSSIIGEFTKSGKPTSTIPWPCYSPKEMNYLDLKPRPEIRQGLDMDTRRLWLDDVPVWIREAEEKAASGGDSSSADRDSKHNEL